MGMLTQPAELSGALNHAAKQYGLLRSLGLTETPPDATLMAVAGHLSREMMEHYSHVRMAAKREALDKLAGGLMKPLPEDRKPASEQVN
jgi:hypothetical protein